jgi:hypothetical protein
VAEEPSATCTRLLPYTTHQVRNMSRCDRAALDKDKSGKPICAVHRGADVRGEKSRQRAKDRYYLRIGINPETGKPIKITD